MSATELNLFSFLKTLDITTKTKRHEPVFTVDEAKTVRIDMLGGHSKNLFVRDKKKRRALVMVCENRKVDLALLAERIGFGRISFSSANSLKDMLGVIPGAVTPFSLINAQVSNGSAAAITVVLDAALIAQSPLYFHPLHNEATTPIEPDDLLKFIRACGYDPITIDFGTT